jgi:hypothetical protein
MTKTQAETNRTKTVDTGDDQANLDCQYRSIGISAVAAALPFVGKAKTQAERSAGREDDRASGDRRRSVLAV